MDTPEQTSREISRTVAEALRVAGISQRSAAEATGIPLTTLSRRLTGAAPFLVTELFSLAKVLGTTVSALTETAA
jgi:transcriptional regulator with XRE-family HTH domain